MPFMPTEEIVKLMPKLLAGAKNRLEPVLGYLTEKKLVDPKVLPEIEKAGHGMLTQGLMKAYKIGEDKAALRVNYERMVDRGALPTTRKPGAGQFELTKPTLIAKPGEPLAMYKHIGASPAVQGEWMFGANSNPVLDAAEAGEKMVSNMVRFQRALRPFTKSWKNPSKDPGFIQDVTNGYKQALPHTEELQKAALALEKLKRTRGVSPTQIEEADALMRHHLAAVEAIRIPIMQKWAQRSASVRTMLALEPSRHPWVAPLLHPEEVKAVNSMRNMLNIIGKEAKELKIPTIGAEYVPHYMSQLLAEFGKRHKGLVTPHLWQLPEAMKWTQRAPGSVQWWPVAQSLEGYLPDAFRKLAFSRVNSKWNPIWEKLAKSDPNGATYFKNWLQQLEYGEGMRSKLGAAIDFGVGIEYLDKVGFSASTAFKHLLKSSRLIAAHPVATFKALPYTVRAIAEPILKRAGIEESYASKIAKSMLVQRAIFRGFSGMEANKGLGKYLFNMVTSMPTSLVEAGERYTTIVASMMKGMNKDLTLNQTLRGVYGSMLDVNFLGQVDRHMWLKTPLARLFALFYYTPLRVTETSLKQAIFSAIPYKEVVRSRNGMYTAAWKMRKDAFGSPYAYQALRMGAILYGAEKLANAYDTSVWHWMAFHIPSIREGLWGSQPVVPPPLDIAQKGYQLGGGVEGYMAALADHFGMYSAQKLARMIYGESADIPKIYQGEAISPQVRYWLSLPSISSLENTRQQKGPARQKYVASQRKKTAEKNKWNPVYQTMEAFKNFLGYAADELSR
jgi:hypothetical protein